MTSLRLRFIIVCACIGRDDLEFGAGMTKPTCVAFNCVASVTEPYIWDNLSIPVWILVQN
jgi:hypothetical protein